MNLTRLLKLWMSCFLRVLYICCSNDDEVIVLIAVYVWCVLLKVGRVDCRLMRTECNSLHVHKFPAFAVFKADFGHEIHHGNSHATYSHSVIVSFLVINACHLILIVSEIIITSHNNKCWYCFQCVCICVSTNRRQTCSVDHHLSRFWHATYDCVAP